MPTYDYICESCQEKREILQKISEAPLTLCTACNKPALRRGVGGGIGLVFKGTGFYITDYARPSPPLEQKKEPTAKTPTA